MFQNFPKKNFILGILNIVFLRNNHHFIIKRCFYTAVH